MMSLRPATPRAVVVGGGPAGLMAAEVLASAGMAVELFDRMPSLGRKLLMAGRGGLNLTHSESRPAFLGRYGDRQAQITPWLDRFDADALRAWADGLGIETFVGTSGRVFPKEMKAAPLLRRWLHRLRLLGVRIHVRHTWLGWGTDPRTLCFEGPDGPRQVEADATVLALGGGSWPQLGSDGRWLPVLESAGIPVTPLGPSNCGFDIPWTPHFRDRFAGSPLKSIAIRTMQEPPAGGWVRGELVVTATGIEGGAVYGLSAPLRESLAAHGTATLEIDLLPDRPADAVNDAIFHPRGSRSMASHLQSRLGLKGIKTALLREVLGAEGYARPDLVAAALKSLPLRLVAPRPLEEAISSAGGVRFDGLDAGLMTLARPGVFCAGEMIDWEAPTGGYLLTACFASGRVAGDAALDWLRQLPRIPHQDGSAPRQSDPGELRP